MTRPPTAAQRKLLREMGPYVRCEDTERAISDLLWCGAMPLPGAWLDAVVALLNAAAAESPEVTRCREALLLAARKGLGRAVLRWAHRYRGTVREARKEKRRPTCAPKRCRCSPRPARCERRRP